MLYVAWDEGDFDGDWTGWSVYRRNGERLAGPFDTKANARRYIELVWDRELAALYSKKCPAWNPA